MKENKCSQNYPVIETLKQERGAGTRAHTSRDCIDLTAAEQSAVYGNIDEAIKPNAF